MTRKKKIPKEKNSGCTSSVIIKILFYRNEARVCLLKEILIKQRRKPTHNKSKSCFFTRTHKNGMEADKVFAKIPQSIFRRGGVQAGSTGLSLTVDFPRCVTRVKLISLSLQVNVGDA